VTSTVTVLKLGGETLAEQHETLAGLAVVVRDQPVVIVHGGGTRLSGWLERLGIETRFVEGRRVTDDEALPVAVAVLRGLVNAELVAALQRAGALAVGLAGADAGLVRAERVPELGRVGRVASVDPRVVRELLDAGFTPVVASIAIDAAGELCNVNADEVAAGLAAALHGRLLLLTDTDGVRGADGRVIPRLEAAEAERLITDGTISGGMTPKVRAALAVVAAGGREVVIADGRGSGAIARAIGDPAAGTRIGG
jgi:acetylglutamate kinase